MAKINVHCTNWVKTLFGKQKYRVQSNFLLSFPVVHIHGSITLRLELTDFEDLVDLIDLIIFPCIIELLINV